jgi:hypothetical protein
MFGNRNSVRGSLVPIVSSLAIASALATSANAVEYQLGDVSVNVDSTLAAAFGVRTTSQDSRYIAASNGGTNTALGAENVDDGNLNFDRGDIYSASVRAIHDIEMSSGNIGAFVRFSYFYDAISANEGNTRRTELSDAARDEAGYGFDLLDAYVYGDFKVADMPLSIRVGNQVVNWGEALLRQGGISQTNALDVIKVVTPGAELREAYLPSPMIWANVGITPAFSLEAYYQVKWRESRLVPVGEFHSTEDIFGPGAQGFFLAGDPGGTGLPASFLVSTPAGVRKIGDKTPDDQGQFGVAARYYLEDYSTELSLFYINYHSKLPYFAGDASLVPIGVFPFAELVLDDYFAYFPEDIELYGASASFPVGIFAVGVEASYQPDFPVPLESGLTEAAAEAGALAFVPTFGSARNLGVVEMDKVNVIANAQVSLGSGTAFVGNAIDFLGADSVDVVTEVGMVKFDGDAPAGTTGKTFAWGYNLDVSATYSNAFGTDITLTPGVSYSQDVRGSSLDKAATGNYAESRKGLTLKLNASYDNDLTAGISYTNNMGGVAAGDSDRDYITFTTTYSF